MNETRLMSLRCIVPASENKFPLSEQGRNWDRERSEYLLVSGQSSGGLIDKEHTRARYETLTQRAEFERIRAQDALAVEAMVP